LDAPENDDSGPLVSRNDTMNDPTLPSQDATTLPRSQPRPSLDAIFAPRAVAVIGATEQAGGVGWSIVWNLIGSPFGGTVYPANPGRPNVPGIRSYPRSPWCPSRSTWRWWRRPRRRSPE